LLNRPNLATEPRWKNQSTVIYGESIPLVVEVVSTNWRDDYLDKAGDYEEIGIPEYWIVDYLAWVEGGLSATPNNQRFDLSTSGRRIPS
jgi:Uma2 family endonuclease